MDKKFKGILSFLICLILCFSFLPSTVYGAEYNPTEVEVYFSYGTRSNPSRIVHKTGTLPCGTSEGTINDIGFLSIIINCNIKCNAGDVVNVSLDNTHKRYSHAFDLAYSVIYATDENGEGFYISRDKGTYEPYVFTYTDVSIPRDCTIESISFAFEPQKVQYSGWSFSQSCGIGFTECNVTVESESTGFFNSVKQFFQQLFEKLTGAFENIGNWFSELGNTIKEWFQSLINNIKTFFSELGENLRKWFSNIGQWFTDIGDRIGEFFTKLWNRIWWGNENGESEYEKPVINNKLNDIIDTLEDYQEQLHSTIITIGNAADSVSSYISTGTELVNGIINVAGAGFTALIVFGIVFILVRKVVGR